MQFVLTFGIKNTCNLKGNFWEICSSISRIHIGAMGILFPDVSY